MGSAAIAQGDLLRSYAEDQLAPLLQAGLQAQRQFDTVLAAIEQAGPASVPALQAQRNEIHRRRTDEAGDEQVGRVVVDLLRRAELLDDAVLHHRHLVAEGHGLDLVVGDIHGRGLQPLVHQLQLGAHFHPQLGIEVGQRLVEQVDLGPPRQRPAHGHPLLLAAGELRGLAFEQVLDLQQPGHPRHLLVDGGLGHLADLQAEGDVLAHAHGRVQGVGLEDHGDVAVLGAHAADVLAVHQDRTAGDALQPGDAVHQGRLAATRGPDEDQEFAGVDLQPDVPEGIGQAAAVALVQVAQFEGCHVSFVSGVSDPSQPFTAPAVRPRTKYLPAST